MAWLLWVVVVVVVVLCLWLLHLNSAAHRQCTALEAVGIKALYPFNLPFLGHISAFMDPNRFSTGELKRCHDLDEAKSIGYINIMGSVLVIIRGDYALGKEYLARMVQGDNSLPKMQEMYVPIELVFGGMSIINEPSNERHAQLRKVLANGFKNRNLAQVKRYVHELLMELEASWRSKRISIDVSEDFTLITFKVICFLLFGKRLKTDDCGPALSALHVLLRSSHQFSANPIKASVLLLLPPYRRALDTLQSFARSCLAELDLDSETVGAQMLNAGWAPERLMSETLLMIFGGFETTANATANTVYQTLKSEAPWVERLRDEVAAFSGDSLWSEWGKESPIATALFKETLRLDSPVPGGTVRHVPSGGITIGKYHLPAGVGVMCMFQSLNIQPQNFEAPLVWRPDRFLPNSPLGGENFLVSFSTGPRNCVGLPLAYLEGPMLAAYVLSKMRLRIRQHATISWVQVLQCRGFLVDVLDD